MKPRTVFEKNKQEINGQIHKRKKKASSQINWIRNKRKEITIQPPENPGIMRTYYEHLYFGKLEKLEKK